MNLQLAIQDKKKGVFLPASRFSQHAAVRPIADHTAQPEPAGAWDESHFGQDFSQVAVHAGSDAARSGLTPSCPVTPTRCPFGGACHTCPVQVQTKLAINQPGDEYEHEADRVAEQVMQAPGVHLQRRAASQKEPAHVPSIVHEVLRSPGQPLDAETRAFMEPRFGHDFSQVRVHTDAKAAESARALNALAYTVGRDVVSGVLPYAPREITEQRVLAHELAHVVQQRHATKSALQTATLSPASEDQLEREAEAAAWQATQGSRAYVLSGISASHLQRQAAGAAAGPNPAPPARPMREERFGVGRGGHRVDAELDRSICWLTLKIKVAFNFVNVPQAWPSPAHQTRWQNDFINAVTNRWSFRYFLVPDRDCPDETCRRVVARIQVIPVTSNPHFTLTVGYATSFQQSFVSGHSATLDALDTARRADIPQVPAEHEFGHMLGLPHVHCATNASNCYGVTSEERANIMGQGAIVSGRDYNTFAEVMYYFNGCNWHPEPHA